MAFRGSMIARSVPAASAAFVIGLVAIGAGYICPAMALSGTASDFAVEVTFEDSFGRAANPDGADLADCPLAILVNVTIAEGRPDSPNTTLTLSINKIVVDRRNLGPVHRFSSPSLALYEYCWTPASYGDFQISVSVQNGDDCDNRTVLSVPGFTVRSSDLRLTQVFADRFEAVIGRTEVTVFADVENLGNGDGTASVDFRLDGKASLGSRQGPVRVGSRSHLNLTTVFTPELVAEGTHVVIGALAGRAGTEKASGRIYFHAPVPGLAVASVGVSPERMTLEKGGVVPADLTATVINSGNLSRSGFNVTFFDGSDDLATVRVDRPVAPRGSVPVRFTWDVPDGTSAGHHTLSAGMDGQQPLRDGLPQANLTILGVGRVAVACLTASPAVEREGRAVVLSAYITNTGNTDSTGRAVLFRMVDTAGGPPVAIGRITGIDIPAGGSAQVGIGWTLPEVSSEKEARTAEAVIDGEIQATVAVTVLRYHTEVQVLELGIPDGLRVGDRVKISAVVGNAGTTPLKGVRVDFSDGNISLAGSDPFDIAGGESERVDVWAIIPGPGDTVHVFAARAGEAFCLTPRTVGHKLAPAKMRIASYSVDPDIKEAESGSFRQELVLVLVLNNSGELPGTATVSIIDGEHDPIVTGQSFIVPPGNDTTRLFLWVVKGGGTHRAFATVALDDLTEKAATEVDIPYIAPEPDRPMIAAALTTAVSVLTFLLAAAARKWKARSAKARLARRRAGGPVAVTANRRIEMEPRFRQLHTEPGRTGK